MSQRLYLDPDPEQRDPQPSAGASGENVPATDWLKGDEKAVAESMTQRWVERRKLPDVKTREARWQVAELRRDGFTGARLVRDTQDRQTYRAWIPVGGTPNLELGNEARRLCRVFVANLLADPPAPQVFPSDSGEDDRDTADTSERGLGDLQGESRLNTPGKLRDALDTGCTYGSGYIVYTIDPTAGGRKVRTMMASPLAPDTQNALRDPSTGMPWAPMEPVQGPMGPVMDPQDPTGQTPLTQPGTPPEPVERMVHADGQQFTDDPSAAAYDWQRDLKSEVLTGRHVQLLPATAENVWDAHGVMIGTFQSWKTVKGMFPKLGKLQDDALLSLVQYRPEGSEKLLPRHQRGVPQQLDDNAQVFVLVICYKECSDYPDGFYGIAVGGAAVPWRTPWVTYAGGKREALLLPVSQVKLFRNGKTDPNGDGLMDDLGGMSEVMAAQIGHILQYLDWFNNPTTYVPMHSPIQDADILARKPIIRILPGGEPKQLQPPRYPPESLSMFELMRDGASNAAHLMDAAQGMEDPSVKSGRHAYQIIAQAHVQLSEPKQNIERAYIRCCEIELQYARAFGLTGDARWMGDDGEYKMKRWMGADLGGDVKIKPGTMTMLSLAAKAQLVEQWAGTLLAPDEARDMLAGGVGALVGLRDDPWKMEIRRQIAAWEDGPPPGWQPPPPPMPVPAPMGLPMGAPVPGAQPAPQGPPPIPGAQPNQPPVPGVPPGQPMAAPMAPPPPPPPDPIWEPRAHHQLPMVAQTRMAELAKLLAKKKISKMPPEWVAVAEAEFQRMLMLAQPPAPPPAPAPGGEGKPKGESKPPAPAFAGPDAGLPPMDPGAAA